MQVDLTKKILNIDDEPIILPDDKVLTYKLAFITALQNNYPDEQSITGDEKFSRFTLALKIHKASTMDLTIDEVSKIKTLVNKQFGTLVYARVHQYFEEAAKCSPTSPSQ